MSTRVLLAESDGIAVVTLNRPEKHNGVDFEMLEGLITTGRLLCRKKTVRAVVIRGEGPSFCAGLDFASVMKKPMRALWHAWPRPFTRTNHFQEMNWIWRKVPAPVIASIHGSCFGAGLQLALGADFRFVDKTASLSVMENKWGLIPDMAGTVFLNEILPLPVAADLVLTGRLFSGDEAEKLGLAEVKENPFDSAMAFAKQLAQKSPDAMAAGKKILYKNRRGSFTSAFCREARYQLRMFLSRNHRIALKAALKKEAPMFKDRQ